MRWWSQKPMLKHLQKYYHLTYLEYPTSTSLMARHGLELHLIWTSAQQRVKRCFFLNWVEMKREMERKESSLPFQLGACWRFFWNPTIFSDGLLGRCFERHLKLPNRGDVNKRQTKLTQTVVMQQNKGRGRTHVQFFAIHQKQNVTQHDIESNNSQGFFLVVSQGCEMLWTLISVMGELNDGN